MRAPDELTMLQRRLDNMPSGNVTPYLVLNLLRELVDILMDRPVANTMRD